MDVRSDSLSSGSDTLSVGSRVRATLGNGRLAHRLLRPERSYAQPPELQTYDENSPALLLANSELGSRWLREQSQLATRPGRARPGPQYDSDESQSDEESLGDIALVRDARGRECNENHD